MTVPTSPERVLAYVQITQEALHKAAAFEQTHANKQQEVETLIPKVCDAMIAQGRCRSTEREKLAAELRDPAKVLARLIDIAGHRSDEELIRLGKAAGALPEREDRSQPGRRSSETKASDRAWFSRLGVPIQQR